MKPALSRSALLLAALALPPLPAPPGGQYEPREVAGWTVHVQRELLADEALCGDALELLAVKLFDVARAVPAPALQSLRSVPIWLSLEDPVAPCACYHPSAEWLDLHGFASEKARGVEIACAARFLEWTAQQPSMVLHELAHAYHHQVLGHDHPGIRAAFERLRDSERLERVLRWDGAHVRHYALENDQEFFAEMSEAWFGTNDFYPFVRAEVLDFDADTAQLMRELWGG